MDAVTANITAACPSEFSGPSGQLFAGAIAAVVAAHCALTANSWPPDQTREVLDRVAGGLSYDFIVVGAGTAGSLVASRLSAYWTVLLIEAGGDPGADFEVPAFVYNNLNTENDWKYKTYPDEKSCLGQKDFSCSWSQGKGLGGSSSINAMIYIKGHKRDYNAWKDQGNRGWSYDDLLPYFDRIEKKLDLENYKFYENPLYKLFANAYEGVGVPRGEENNIGEAGTKLVRLLTKDGKRLNTAQIFFNESKDLHIMKNALVDKVIIDEDTKISVGVEVRLAEGTIMQIITTKEVILSAGSIATPQILMLSGIGPKKHLEEKNIKPLIDLQVGQNLQDHIFLPVFLTTKNNFTVTPEMFNSFVLEYLVKRTGPLATIGVTDFMAFTSTNNSDYPNIQFMHSFIPKNDHRTLSRYLNNTGYEARVIDAIVKLNEENELIAIYPVLLHPESRGEILLSDNKATSKPVIKPSYFQNPEDIKRLTEGIQFATKLQDTDSFKSLGAKVVPLKLPYCMDFSYDTDDYWECYIRVMATTVYHPVGTAKMGTGEDSVVNDLLLVHGVKGLRVVDASIMPNIVGSNTMATTLAIAEKAVDMIRKDYLLRDEL